MVKDKLFLLMDWIWRLTWLNLLWLLFSLPLITVIPSTFAMYAVVNKWTKDEEVNIWLTFIKSFKNYFLKSYSLGSVLVLIGVFLYADFIILNNQTEEVFIIVRYAVIIFTILYLPVAFFSIPVFIEYNLSWYKSLSVAFIIAMQHPLRTFLVLCGILVDLIILLFFTGFGILFFGSFCALITSKPIKNVQIIKK
jgi:uncharacterized membrane protein YesL